MMPQIPCIADMTDEQLTPLFVENSNGEVVLKTNPIPMTIFGLRAVFDACSRGGLNCAVHFTGNRTIMAEPLRGDEGAIYFVGFSKYVKIGFTTKPRTRFDTIQTSCPEKLIFYGAYKGSIAKEQRLHVKFDDYRLNGEWFHFGKDIRKYIGFTEADAALLRIEP